METNPNSFQLFRCSDKSIVSNISINRDFTSTSKIVDNAIKKKLGKVTKSDVAELCPSLSISAIEKAIAKMVEGRLEKMGSGKTTYYVVKL
ncbi:MAG: hypothetical protein SOY33_00295 [Candidatus Onthovivens sp.]|nr:hypothetical protein [Bacilli bacterium]